MCMQPNANEQPNTLIWSRPFSCWQHTKLVSRDAFTTDSVTDATTDSVTDATTYSVIDATTDSVTDNDDDDIPLAELLRRATAALNIDPDVTMTADEFVTVDKDVKLFFSQTVIFIWICWYIFVVYCCLCECWLCESDRVWINIYFIELFFLVI